MNAFGILACESLHVSNVCIWRCENAIFLCMLLCAMHTFLFIHLIIDSAVITAAWLPTSTAWSVGKQNTPRVQLGRGRDN